MKMVKMSMLAAIIAMSASAAQAFTPPYYVIGGYTGTATVVVSGGCKANEKYLNARYGSVYDTFDDYVGFGLVTADGQLVTIEQDYSDISHVYDTVTFDATYSYYEDMASDETTGAIETIADCNIDTMTANLNSRDNYKVNASKGVEAVSMQFSFGGYTTQTMETKGNKQLTKGAKYTGKVTFKATRELT